MTESEWPQSVPCDDSYGRERAFKVYISEDTLTPRVALVAPPGEVGFMTARSVNALKAVLTAAQVEAIHRERTRYR